MSADQGLQPSDPMARVRAAIDDFKAGKMIILADDEDRENEGDVCIAAEFCTPEAVNFMARHARGLICLAITPERARQLDLPMMVRDSENETPYGTAFTVSIEAREGVTTGISAADRARTVQAAMARDARPSDLTRPGHVFPLIAKPGGVLRRTGQTEGSVDLARLAGLEPAGVICEIMNDDGTMARMPDLHAFAKQHGLRILTVADLIKYRLRTESHVVRGAEAVGAVDVRRLPRGRVQERDRPRGPRRLRARRDPRRRADPGARAQRVPDRRRVRLAALRLRRAARRRR